jgi:hypothetical protein
MNKFNPTKDNGPNAPHDRPVKKATNDLNFATGDRPSKAIATLIAELAIRGHAVHQLKEDGFFVCNHGQSHYAPDFYALQRFAIKVGASK